jgi:molecular chaperone DnaK (HSP70)
MVSHWNGKMSHLDIWLNFPFSSAAKNQSAMNPKNTVFDAKRLIGRRFDDQDVKKDMKVSSTNGTLKSSH